jgi:rhodanese-related sulfurtransferase
MAIPDPGPGQRDNNPDLAWKSIVACRLKATPCIDQACPLCSVTMSRHLRQLGFAFLAALAGDGSTKTADAGEPDAAADSPAPDLAQPDLRADEATPPPDATLLPNQAADGPRAEAPAAERPGGDGDAGCDGWTTLKRISPAEASALIATTDPIVLNVHYPYEGDIPGTDATIPFDDVPAIEAYLKYDRCADVLLVCRSGSMSQTAGNELVKRGYLRIQELKGGMIAWEAAGYPLLKDGGP